MYNVLMIEDDPVTADFARSAAEPCPEINLTVVGGGDVVLDWLSGRITEKAQMPHIILMDLKLPKLDGLAVLRKLRMHAATREIPIVVFSAEYTQDDMLTSYHAGANSFVAKPADQAQLGELFRVQQAYWMRPVQREMFNAADGDFRGKI
ncbi:MAG: response regulator [Gallionella sp.]|nr:response regulator [Gallionella sp.]